jgi:hypothetical protein
MDNLAFVGDSIKFGKMIDPEEKLLLVDLGNFFSLPGLKELLNIPEKAS